jgi:hypothetical protein
LDEVVDEREGPPVCIDYRVDLSIINTKPMLRRAIHHLSPCYLDLGIELGRGYLLHHAQLHKLVHFLVNFFVEVGGESTRSCCRAARYMCVGLEIDTHGRDVSSARMYFVIEPRLVVVENANELGVFVDWQLLINGCGKLRFERRALIGACGGEI